VGGRMPGSVFGVGVHANIVTASLLAVVSAVNRAVARAGIEPRQDATGVRQVA
jgi:2-isopropylmalate synthase